jgi:hypothetical protein
MISKLIFGIAVFGCIVSALRGEEIPFGVHVVDDKGNSLPGIEVVASTDVRRRPGSDSTIDRKTALTDNDGHVNYVFNESSWGDISWVVTDPSGKFYGTLLQKMCLRKNGRGGWENATPVLEVALRKVISPIPMLVRSYDGRIPNGIDECGFDLIKADWVRPNGNGETPHLVFRRTISVPMEMSQWGNPDATKPFDATVRISASGQNAGMLSFEPDKLSFFSSPYEAPGGDYVPFIEARSYRLSGGKITTEQTGSGNYVLRLNADADGNIQWWGKIYGGFSWSPVGGIKFQWYINTNHESKSLEWNMKDNLAKDNKGEGESVLIRP